MEKRASIDNRKTVYIAFSTDTVHSGHIAIIRRAQSLGELVVGVLSDAAVSCYKRPPMLPCEERKALFENIVGVSRVIVQHEVSYRNVVETLKPDYVVHGDDWRSGDQEPIREELVRLLRESGGELVEYPYSSDKKYQEIDEQFKLRASMPDYRRGCLRKMLATKPTLSIIEAHSGITGLIAEKTVVYEDGQLRQFDGIWVSSLCDSTAKGKPDIELVDMTSRIQTINDIMEVTTKPIILDGDTGGMTEHFSYNVRTLERMGVSAVIIEDKIGLKRNSLFGVDAKQVQAPIEEFAEKIAAGKHAQQSDDFMIIARIESLILERGMNDALARAIAFTEAGADGIMIHSRKQTPGEVFEFARQFRKIDATTPLVVVPTTYNSATEEEFTRHGVNVVIYANHLMRSGVPAMRKTAEMILRNRRALEADELCMPIEEILGLIPEWQ